MHFCCNNHFLYFGKTVKKHFIKKKAPHNFICILPFSNLKKFIFLSHYYKGALAKDILTFKAHLTPPAAPR